MTKVISLKQRVIIPITRMVTAKYKKKKKRKTEEKKKLKPNNKR